VLLEIRVDELRERQSSRDLAFATKPPEFTLERVASVLLGDEAAALDALGAAAAGPARPPRADGAYVVNDGWRLGCSATRRRAEPPTAGQLEGGVPPSSANATQNGQLPGAGVTSIRRVASLGMS
jgi:hypothetical protein